jgi:hypothetical protein
MSPRASETTYATPCASDVHSEKACHDNDDDDHANDVEDIHCHYLSTLKCERCRSHCRLEFNLIDVLVLGLTITWLMLS